MDTAALPFLRYAPVFGLLLCRCGGVVMTAPVLRNPSLPPVVKAGFTVLLAIALLPAAMTHPFTAPAHAAGYLPLGLTELGLGLVFGFAGVLILEALRSAGELVTEQMGLSLGQVASPEHEDEEESAVGTLFWLVGTLVFLAVDGHHWVINALAASCREIPPGGTAWPEALGASLVRQFCELFVWAVRLAAPLLAVMFLVTVGIGLLAKSVPQMNILLVGYPVKVFLGLTALTLLFPLLLPVMLDAFAQLERNLAHLLRLMIPVS